MKKIVAFFVVVSVVLSLVSSALAQEESNGFYVKTETKEDGNTVTSFSDSEGVTFTVEEVDDFSDEVVINDDEEEAANENDNPVAEETAIINRSDDEPDEVQVPDQEAQPQIKVQTETKSNKSNNPFLWLFVVLLIAAIMLFIMRKRIRRK